MVALTRTATVFETTQILLSVTEAKALTVLQRSSLADHIHKLRSTRTGNKKASYRDIARATGIPLSVLHAIAKEKIVIPDWIAKLASAHRAEWVLAVPRRSRQRQP